MAKTRAQLPHLYYPPNMYQTRINNAQNFGGGGSLSTIGFNFRNAAAGPTDGANETYVIATDEYPITRAGFTFGWTTLNAIAHDNYGGTPDRRIAGEWNGPFGGSTFTFRADIAPGTYNLRIAAGNPSFGSTINFVVKDDSTTRLTVGPTSIAGNEFLDATQVARTSTTWPTDNAPLSVNISTGILILTSSGAGAKINHISISPA